MQKITEPATHGREVEQLWADYARKRNRRVPITFAADEQVWTRVSGHTFKEFYLDPPVHLNTQLEGARWFGENVVCDLHPGLPERWTVGVRNWMEENEFFGCEIVYQEDDFAWAMPLDLDRDDLLRHIAEIDPEERVRSHSAFRMYEALKDLADGMTYMDRPVQVSPPLFGTHGIFTKAAEIRGLEQICIDTIESPEFVEEYLRIFTEKTIERMRAWHTVVLGKERELPSAGGYGFADDSLQMISPDMYERFVMPRHERLYSVMATGTRSMHLCGKSSQHYENLRRKMNVTCIDGPGPFIDHAYWLEKLGPDFAFNAQVNHTTLMSGTEGEIRGMMADLMTPGAKLPGRFQVLGYITRDTPPRNLEICYRAGREYGVIEA